MCHGMHIAKTGRIERHASQELRVPQCMFTHHNLGQQAWKKRENLGNSQFKNQKK